MEAVDGDVVTAPVLLEGEITDDSLQTAAVETVDDVKNAHGSQLRPCRRLTVMLSGLSFIAAILLDPRPRLRPRSCGSIGLNIVGYAT